MYFKELDEFTVEKLENGSFKFVFYGDLKHSVGESLALWSKEYGTLYDGLVDLFEGWTYDSTEIIGQLLMGEDGMELSVEDKRDVIENLGEEGRFSLSDTGYVIENVAISVSSVQYGDDAKYLTGAVGVDGVNYPFDYNVVAQELEIHHYSDPSWLDGSSYEKDLPHVVLRNIEDIDEKIMNAVSEFFVKNIHKPTEEELDEALAEGWTEEEINRGYAVFTDGNGAEYIARLDILQKFDGDWAAAEQAEKDGYVIMRDKYRDFPYLDTEENRKILGLVGMAKNPVDKVKEIYMNEDVVMSELLRSDEFSGLSRDEKEELLAWSGDDGFLAVAKEGEIVVLDDLSQEEKREILFPKAVAYYSEEASVDVYNEFVQKHADEYVYCWENGKDLIDLDFWCDYQELLGEKIAYDEYIAIDECLDGAPADYTAEDVEVVNVLRERLCEFRAASKGEVVDNLLADAKDRVVEGNSGDTGKDDIIKD